MTFDILGAIDLGALAVLVPGLLIVGSPLTRARQAVLAGIVGGWFVVLVSLAAGGFFSPRGAGVAGLGAALLLPLIAAAVALRGSPTVRALVAGTPLPLMVALHLGRLLGVQFVILHAFDRLPAAFAYCAGYGDVLVALLAVPAALAIQRQARGWRGYALAWNIAGVTDLLVAVTLGVGSAPGSPLRFIHQEPASDLMVSLPWFLIPGFLVPFYLALHLFVFARLAETKAQALPASLFPVKAA